MKCPVCKQSIKFSVAHAQCINGHNVPLDDNVFQFSVPEQQADLDRYLSAVEDWRSEAITQVSPSFLRSLPFTSEKPELWKIRQYDLDLLNQISSKEQGLKAMELGAWNCWLTNHLVSFGYKTTAIDIFMHELDGLKANKHYPNTWRSIQMPLSDLSLIDETYDLIVVNRCINYMQTPDISIPELKKRLKKGGKLVFLGLTYTKNPQKTIQRIKETDVLFKSKYGIGLKMSPFKGYLEKSDLSTFKKEGIELRVYPKIRLKSMLGKVISTRPQYYYGLYSHNI